MRTTFVSAALAAAALGILAVATIDCGGSSAVCGNGITETGETCDKGPQNGKPGIACSSQCQAISVKIPQLNVTWGFNLLGKGSPIPGYVPPGCPAFGATKARVQIEGPSPFDRVVECMRYGMKYTGVCPEVTDAGQGDCEPLGAGVYQVTVTLLRDDSSAVTNAVSTGKLTVSPGPEVNFPILFEQQDFLNQGYTGNLDFIAHWGQLGGRCDTVMPKVTEESILLVPEGAMMPVMGMTRLGTRLDGTPGTCYLPDNIPTPERVENVLWGRYNLSIYSRNAGYCVRQPVFVNPGKFNDTYKVVVPLVPPPPDGGVGDGGADDGGAGDGGMAPTCP